MGKRSPQTIGEQPRPVLEANLEALVANLPLPYTQGSGQISAFESSVSSTTTSQDDPS